MTITDSLNIIGLIKLNRTTICKIRVKNTIMQITLNNISRHKNNRTEPYEAYIMVAAK